MKKNKEDQLHHMTEQIIRYLKQDSNYQLDTKITKGDLFEILRYRGIAVIRGYFLGWRLANSTGFLLVGHNVTLRHKGKISVGQSVILEDYVFIDALSQKGVVLGDNVTIARHSTLQCTGVIQEIGSGIRIGNNSALGAYSFLGGQGGITIGDNVIMGPKVNIFSENHEFRDPDILIKQQKPSRKGVIIEDNCWIGANSTIVDGVRIKSGCVIAAGSVVTKDFDNGSILAGVPARLIANRGS
jgi:acetyltransferase-like isoleucine patch superfamily enzyme